MLNKVASVILVMVQERFLVLGVLEWEQWVMECLHQLVCHAEEMEVINVERVMALERENKTGRF